MKFAFTIKSYRAPSFCCTMCPGIAMDGPDYAKVPEYVKRYLRRGGDAFLSEGAPDRQDQDPHFETPARAALLQLHFKRRRDPGHGKVEGVLWCFELLVSPKPELSNREEYRVFRAYCIALQRTWRPRGTTKKRRRMIGRGKSLDACALGSDASEDDSVADFQAIAADRG
jgi:hypothetical protein